MHRDLKPANILVTQDGTPRLLDFGIAKLMDANATATAMQALTPEYASPEQVRGGAITTACDVYSLGMVLYELVTGRLPYEIPASRSPMDIHRAICLTEAAPANVSGDLDNILAMALRKEPERRYGSVELFAQDIERMLASRPVMARPDTLRYRSARFLRRNRLALAAASIAAIGLCAGAAVALHQAGIAREQARIAQQQSRRNGCGPLRSRYRDPPGAGRLHG
ncbi:MAG TPA: serine/threonine-protein kinase [Candidatus Sulfopaludibacter sp.]|nr:serine/threonine-protein kinase [Candidatus Sulfopaludibacter sp.]